MTSAVARLDTLSPTMRTLRSVMKADPDYPALNMDALVAAFKALPEAKSSVDIKRSGWTVHLQYPTSYFTTKETETMEVTIFRPGMLEPVTVPCERRLLQKRESLPYLLSLILAAFTEGSHKLLEQEIENYEIAPSPQHAEPLTLHGTQSHSQITTDSVLRKKTAGNLPANLQMFRPTEIHVRDASLISQLTIHCAIFNLADMLWALPYFNFESGYTNRTGSKFRKDVTFCGYEQCSSLSTSHSRCSRCHVTFYCSGEHQKEHWARHKAVCTNTKGILEEVTAEKAAGKLKFLSVGKTVIIT